jgi:alkylation response protein AidB-like acyl-CoA dehydrogenase
MIAIQDELTAEFAATAEDILTRLAADKAVAADLAENGFSPLAWSAAAEAGWLEALLAESAGGLGLSLRELGPIFTAAGRHLFVGPLAEHAVGGALAASEAPEAVGQRLAATLAGERRLALVDLAPAATLHAGLLSGACELVRFAGQADELLVAVATDSGPALVLVEHDRPGVRVAPRPSLDPVTLMASVRFDGVDVGHDDLVASGHEAAGVVARIGAGMRIAVACELAGIVDHVLALTVDYAKEREQFGRPIGSFQAVAHMVAEMAREAFGLSQLCLEAASAAGDDPARLQDASLVAKAHAAATARSVIEASLQVHGGIAFTVEHPLHRYYKHALFLEGLYGDRHELHELLGRRLLTAAGEAWTAWT